MVISPNDHIICAQQTDSRNAFIAFPFEPTRCCALKLRFSARSATSPVHVVGVGWITPNRSLPAGSGSGGHGISFNGRSVSGTRSSRLRRRSAGPAPGR